MEDFSSGLPLKNCLTHVNTICFNSGHSVLKKPTVNPSCPDDFPDLKENSIDLISSSVGCCVSHLFMSGENILGNVMGGGMSGKGEIS